LFEAKEIFYITSYVLLFNGEEIDEFIELEKVPDLTDGSTLEMAEG
jgi:hypothetical protein